MAKSKSVLPELRAQSVRTVFIIGLLLLIITGWLWWRQVASNPRNVFEGMLENSLKTTSVSRRTSEDSGVQQLDQTLHLQSGNQKIVRSLTTLSQAGDSSAVVKTESLGTPTDDYVRYTQIETDQTNQEGKPLDFSDVLNVWGRTSAESGRTSGELYGESTLGIVPIGFLPRNERNTLRDFIKERDVYAVDYSQVKKEIQNGRPHYIYPVEVNPSDYVSMLKQFAEAVGLNQLDEFDPQSFEGTPKLQFELTVDVWSRQLVKTTFASSGREETYGSYGAWVPTVLPEETINVEELQGRLQRVQ